MQTICSLPVSTKARLAGLFFLLYAATGGVGYGVSQSLIISGDAAATAGNILANERTFRLAIAANLLSAACYLVVAALLYDVFKLVDRTVARLAIFFLMISCAIGAFDSLFQYAALDVLQPNSYLGAFDIPQRQALAHLLLKQNVRALDMGLIFFGFMWIVLGHLIIRSRFLPRIVGVIAVFDGLWYLTHLYRPLAAALLPYTMMVPAVGGIGIMLWLTIKGVDTRRVNELSQSSLAGRP